MYTRIDLLKELGIHWLIARGSLIVHYQWSFYSQVMSVNLIILLTVQVNSSQSIGLS